MTRKNMFSNRFWYDKMKPKQKKDIQEATYFNMMLNMLLTMFQWNDLPDSLPARYLDSANSDKIWALIPESIHVQRKNS